MEKSEGTKAIERVARMNGVTASEVREEKKSN